MLRTNLIIYIFLVFCFSNSNYILAQEISMDNSEKELKIALGFDQWNGKQNMLRNGINLSKANLKTISNATEVRPENLFFMAKNVHDINFVKYRCQWQETKSDFVEITLSFLNSCLEAHEYLIENFISSTLPFEIKSKSLDIPSTVGDVSFYGGRCFIRNNIVVNIHAEGTMTNIIENLAKEIDLILLSQKTEELNANILPRLEIDNQKKIRVIEP